MSKKNIIINFVIFISSLIFIAGGSYFYTQEIISKPYNTQDNNKKEFVIQSGESVEQIAVNLKK